MPSLECQNEDQLIYLTFQSNIALQKE